MKRLVIVIFAMLMITGLFGETIYVNHGESIQDAIDDANNGDIVFVYNGTYTGAIEIVNIELTLQGESRDECIIQATESITPSMNSTIYANSWTSNLITIKDLTVRRGHNGIQSVNSPYCNLVMENVKCTLNNYGVTVNGTNAEILNCSIIDNRYTGLYISDSNINIIDCVISDNNGYSTISNNPIGGGVYVGHSNEVYISGTEITNNFAYDSGGGLAMITNTNTITFDENNLCIIENNNIQAYAGEGDDLYADNNPVGSVTVYTTSTPICYPINYWVISAADIEPNEIIQTYNLCYNFPNPVGNYTTIYLMSDNINDAIIDIYNAKGQRVSTVETENGSVMLNTSDYTSGVYFYKVRNSEINVVQKMVIIK